MKTKLAIAAAVLGTLLGVSAASANPIYIGYSINGGTKNILASNSTGIVNFNNTSPAPAISGLRFNLSATGSPFLNEPDLQTSQITVRNSGSSSAVIRVFVSETNLTTTTDFLQTGYGNNGNSAVNIDIASYVQNCVVAGCGTTVASGDVFATTNLLYSTTGIVPGTGGNNVDPFPAGITGDYNETLVYTFNLAVGQSVSATLALMGINQSVPEPLTLSLFGAGLAGLAASRRRKKAQA